MGTAECGSIFLVHWDASEADEFAAPLRTHGCEVLVEHEDGGAAFRRIKESRPVAVLVFLTRLPAHGRRLAEALRTDATTREIPVVFVGGKEWAIEHTREEFPEAAFADPEAICDELKPLLPE